MKAATRLCRLIFSYSHTLFYRALLAASILYSQAQADSDLTARNEVFSEIAFANVTVDNHQMAYAFAGDSSRHGLLFLHGTPGGWGAFKGYLNDPQLQQDFFLVSVDRLGWGDSPLPSEMVDGDFELQAQAVVNVMAAYPGKKWTIIGHSLGASIAPKIALLEPEATLSLVLLAGSLDPELGRPRWYNRAANTWVVSRLIGKSMRYSNREIMGLRQQLEALSVAIERDKLPTRVVVIQGMKDRLVSPKNSAFAQREWTDNFAQLDVIELPKAGHFLPWRQASQVISAIYQITPGKR